MCNCSVVSSSGALASENARLRPFFEQDLDVLPGQELQPFAGWELEFDDHHIGRGARHLLHAHRQGLDGQVTRRAHFAYFDFQVALRLGTAEQREPVTPVVLAQSMKLRLSVVDLAAQHPCPGTIRRHRPGTCKAGSTPGVQGRVENGLVGLGGKGVRPRSNADLDSHQNSLRVDSGKIVR